MRFGRIDMRIGCGAVLLCAALASAAWAANPDGKETLLDAQKAIRGLKAVRYEVDFDAKGPMEIRYPKMTGTVSAMRDAGHGKPGTRVDLNITPRTDKPPYRIEIASDGAGVALADHGQKTFTALDSPDGDRLLLPTSIARIDDFVAETPFEQDLKSGNPQYAGSETVAGEDCYVVLVNLGGDGQRKWYISKKDKLPRGVDRVVPTPIGAGTTQMVRLKKLEVDPTLSAGFFRMVQPADFVDAGSRKANEAAAALNKTEACPDWTLKTPDGKDVALKDLKGKVVLLDFWATWCGPCKMAMPGVQRIHDKFKDKAVAVYGVSTWERPPGDPVAYMKQNKYTYGLLMKGDELAAKFGFTGIPSFVLIGKDGSVLMKFSGFSKSGEAQVEAAIEQALKK